MGIFEDMIMKKIKNVGKFGVRGECECDFWALEGVIWVDFFGNFCGLMGWVYLKI